MGFNCFEKLVRNVSFLIHSPRMLFSIMVAVLYVLVLLSITLDFLKMFFVMVSINYLLKLVMENVISFQTVFWSCMRM